MHRLLIPVDNSDNAMRALEHALRLAKENGPMELVIVHAHEPPIVTAKSRFTCMMSAPRSFSGSTVKTFSTR